jgi:hypothetical protein
MSDNKRARRVVKANDALTKAKDKQQRDGTPVPDKLRKELKDAIADFEKHNQ